MFRFTSALFALSFLAQLAPNADRAIAAEPVSGPMRVLIIRDDASNCEPDCAEWISAQGMIVASTEGQFRKLFKTLGTRKLPVLLHSGGGQVEASFNIARMIRERGLETVVARTLVTDCKAQDKACRVDAGRGQARGSLQGGIANCASACAFILAGGVLRHVPFAAFVGVHRMSAALTHRKALRRYLVHYRLVNGKRIETDRKLISEKIIVTGHSQADARKDAYTRARALFAEMGMTPLLISLLQETPNEKVLWLTPSQLNLSNLASDRFPVAGIVARKPVPNSAPAVLAAAASGPIFATAAPKGPVFATAGITIGYIGDVLASLRLFIVRQADGSGVEVQAYLGPAGKIPQSPQFTLYLTLANGATFAALKDNKEADSEPFRVLIPNGALCTVQGEDKSALRIEAPDIDYVPAQDARLRRFERIAQLFDAVCGL